MADERRIPVFKAVGLTYDLLRRFWWQATVRNIGAVILLLAVYVGHELILPTSEMMEMQTQDPAQNLRASLLNMVYLLVLMVPWTMLFVAFVRIGISNRVENNGQLGLYWGKRETCVFLRGALLILILVAIATPIMLIVSLAAAQMMGERMEQAAVNPLNIWPFMLTMFVFIGLPIGYLYMRWMIYAVAPAVDQSHGMGASWRMTVNNGWRMLAICFLAYLPFMVFSILQMIAVFEYGVSMSGVVTYISWVVSIAALLAMSFVIAVIYDYLVPKQESVPVDVGFTNEGPAH